MKVLFQDICITKVDWDTELSEEFCIRWSDILSDLESVLFIKFNRCYCFNYIHDPIMNIQIHSFSDASNRIYAGVVYLRFILKSGIIKTSLVSSKCKISAINGSVTIPRAELNGVLLMSQITLSVYNSLKNVYDIAELFYWTDSSIVLSWVMNVDKIYKVYLQQRLLQIRENISDL